MQFFILHGTGYFAEEVHYSVPVPTDDVAEGVADEVGEVEGSLHVGVLQEVHPLVLANHGNVVVDIGHWRRRRLRRPLRRSCCCRIFVSRVGLGR